MTIEDQNGTRLIFFGPGDVVFPFGDEIWIKQSTGKKYCLGSFRGRQQIVMQDLESAIALDKKIFRMPS